MQNDLDDYMRSEFERLMRQDPQGLLRPEAIIEVAQRADHPFHERFTWDDTEAANKWRYEEAQMLIRSYKVIIPPLDVRVRALTSLDVDRTAGGGYRWVTDVMKDKNLRLHLLETAIRELKSLENKYRHLEELSSVWDSINKAEGSR